MKVIMLGAAAALALALGACDAGGRATAKAPPPSLAAAAPAADPRDAPVALVDGKPMWAANRKHTAEENAAYQYAKNGKDFGAKSQADYVARAHAFTAAPPASVQRLERANGDALLYDPKTNTFAVVTRAGAPRTMFKPRSGAAYWRQQQDREAARESGDDASQG
ncbi:MAG: hypothetical protein JO127_19715 [Caulobacteraceae bacterium]|nr:hypothetical protein [Caulobacteraceae bacterium]